MARIVTGATLTAGLALSGCGAVPSSVTQAPGAAKSAVDGAVGAANSAVGAANSAVGAANSAVDAAKSAVGMGGGAAPTCATMVPTAEVVSNLKISGAAVSEQRLERVVVCTFSGKLGGKNRTAIVRVERGVDAATFAATRQGFTTSGQKTVDAAGIGDAAFSSELTAMGITTRTVVARKGTDVVLVTSPATLAQEKALAVAVFQHLR